MDILLTDNEVRVLGCLLEKEMATPEYYPLSLNALVNACNQKSNRNPVVSFSEETVVHALNGLQEAKLVRQSNVSRVAKYEQIFTEKLNLLSREAAVLCILLVRGPQTIGEVRGRTERLYGFSNLEEAQETIANLEEMGLVCSLPKQPGRKESRYAHLLSGDPVQQTSEEPASGLQAGKVVIRKDSDRIAELQSQIDSLHRQLESLQGEFAAFKAQFE